MAAPRIRIAPGLLMPFFPMRPSTGRLLDSGERAVELWHEFRASGDTVQPKLNGDRACVGVVPDTEVVKGDRDFFVPLVKSGVAILVQNRHGSRFKHKVNNLALFNVPGSCWDGEVWDGNFWPFECLAFRGKSFMHEGPERRARAAQQFCRTHGTGWIFDEPDEGYFQDHLANLPYWEGIVRKKKDSPYIPGRSATAETSSWFRHRWK